MRGTGTDVSLESLLKLLQPGMPKVVPDQWAKFLQDPLFQRLQQENAIVYSPFRDRPMAERRNFMMQELQEGFVTVGVNSLGLTLRLVLDSTPWQQKPHGSRTVTSEEVRLDEAGRVHLRSRFILNGVCVIWVGTIRTDDLCGTARLQFDSERAEAEMRTMKEQLLNYHRMQCGATGPSDSQSLGAATSAGSAAAVAPVLPQQPPPHLQPAGRTPPKLRRSASSAFEAIDAYKRLK